MKKAGLLFFLLTYISLCSLSQPGIRGTVTTGANGDTIKRNLALVVGISSYPKINRLLYADDDANLFADYLVSQHICEKKDVSILIDSVATKANFFKELRKLLDRSGEGDRVFIYFAGHGDVENDIESGFLLTYNCEPNNYPASDAIDISMLEKFVAAFTKKNTKVVLITDACRSGNLAGGSLGSNSTITSLSRGFQNIVKILSCQPNQLSQEKYYPGGGHGVFTYHLIDGLSGLADKDNDQFVSLRELDRYLDEVGLETGQEQVPKTEGDPQVRIASFSKEIKLALLARKENKTAVATVTKNRGRADSSRMNNKYFTAFNEFIRKNQLTEPAKDNAYAIILEASRAGQSKEMTDEMKWELAAILEDEAQKFINMYLRGELPTDQREVIRRLNSARGYLATLEMIIGENDIRYKEIHVKKLFFDAYIIFKNREKLRFSEALSYLETANSLLRNQAWICNAMGLFYEDLKKPAQAESTYKKASILAPHWSYPWNNLGMLYWNQANYPEAEAAYKNALRIDSSYGYAWNGLGNVYDDLERYEEAIEAYRNSIRYNPLDDDPWNGLGNVYHDMKKMDEAEAAYKQSALVDTSDAYPWNGLGNVYSDLDRDSEAEEAYLTSIRKDSMFTHGWNNYGLLMEKHGMTRAAEEYFRFAISIDSNYADAWRNLADLLTDVGRTPEAIPVYKKYFTLAAGNSDSWNNLGLAHKSNYEYNEAEAAYLKGISIDSLNYYCWFNLGVIYKIGERYSDAALCFKKAVEINPANRFHWEYLLEMLDKSGNKEEWSAWKEKMKTRFPMD